MIGFIRDLAIAAGEESLRYFGNIHADDISCKVSSKDLVSVADKAVEKMIVEKIGERFPEHDVFGEESGHANRKSDYCWIIDPIDGTQSFVKGHPYYSVSIALYRKGVPVAAAVNAPALGRLFTAEVGKGAEMNGRKIHVSDCASLNEAACVTGFARLRENKVEESLQKFVRILPILRDIKRCGSAACDLCFTAAGIYDGYWEEGLQLYDVAAGVLIVREAGGVVCDYLGGNDIPFGGIIAGNSTIVSQLRECLS